MADETNGIGIDNTIPTTAPVDTLADTIASDAEVFEKAAETTAAIAAVIPGAEEVAIVAGLADTVAKAVEAEAIPEAGLIEKIGEVIHEVWEDGTHFFHKAQAE